jgi:hypothetical protein
MNWDVKILNKMLETEFNNALRELGIATHICNPS